MRRVSLVIALVVCAACSTTPRQDEIVSPPTTEAGPLSARIELDSTTIEAGDRVAGRVVVVNNTGNTVRAQGCNALFQVALSNDDYKPDVAWQDCLQDFLIPMGESTYPVIVLGSLRGCSARSRPGVDCDANNGNAPLEPGEYEARLYQRNRVVPDPEPVAVAITD